ARDEASRDAQLHVRDLRVGQIRDRWLTPQVIDRLSAGDMQARLWLQELARQPDEYRPFVDVYYWGAFICQGNPSPLSTVRPRIAGTGVAIDWPIACGVSPDKG